MSEGSKAHAKVPSPDSERRENTRFPVNVVIHGETGSSAPLMFSRDISEGGIAIETTDALQEANWLKEGTFVTLTFALPFGSQFIRVQSEIAWIRKNVENFDGNSVTVVGLAFQDVDDSVASEINKFTSRLDSAASAVPQQASKPEAQSVAHASPQVKTEPVERQEKPAIDPNQMTPIDEEPVDQGEEAPAFTGVAKGIPSLTVEDFHAKAKSLMQQKGEPDSVEDKIFARFLKTMLPKDRAIMLGEKGHAEVIQHAATLPLKMQVEKMLYDQTLASSDSSLEESQLVQTRDDYQIMTIFYSDQCRQEVARLYAAGQTPEGQEVNQIINRIDAAFREFQATLVKSSGKIKHDRAVHFQPIKAFFDVITKAVRGHAGSEEDVTVDGVKLKSWESMVFTPGNEYWTREQRTVVAAIVALHVKLRIEMGLLKQAYDEDKHVVDESEELWQQSNVLMAKVLNKAEPLLGQLKSDNDMERSNRVSESITRLKATHAEVQRFNEELRANLEALSGETPALSEKLYEGGRPKPKAAKEKKSAKKKAKKKSANVVKAALLILGLAGLATQIPTYMAMLGPRAVSSSAYQQLFNVKEVRRWQEWVFITVNAQDWKEMSEEAKKQKAEEIFQYVQSQGAKSLEINGQNNETFVTTFGQGNDPRVLRVY